MKKYVGFYSILIIASLVLLICTYILFSNQNENINILKYNIEQTTKDIEKNSEINDNKKIELEQLKQENESKIKELELWKETQEKVEHSL